MNIIKYLFSKVKKIEDTLKDLLLEGLRGVVFDNNDPEQLSRIKIRIPELDNMVTDWAYPDNSRMGGISNEAELNIPKNNSLVWVSFEKGNIEYPKWSHSCIFKDTIPSKLLEDYPNTRGFHTKENLYCVYNDTKRIIEMGNSETGDYFQFDASDFRDSTKQVSRIKVFGHNGNYMEMVEDDKTGEHFIRVKDMNGSSFEFDVKQKIISINTVGGHVRTIKGSMVDFIGEKRYEAVVDTKEQDLIGGLKTIIGSFITPAGEGNPLLVDTVSDWEIIPTGNTNITTMGNTNITSKAGKVEVKSASKKNIELNGGTKSLTNYPDLNTGLQALITKINIELGEIQKGISGAGGTYLKKDTSLVITDAEVKNVKTGEATP